MTSTDGISLTFVQTPEPSPLYFRQLLSGQDFARQDPFAQQMVNFVYLIGDRSTGDCVVVDPAYSVAEIDEIAQSDGMNITDVLGTHFHADHIGGSIGQFQVEGVAALLERRTVKLHVQRQEKEWVLKSSGLSEGDLVLHDPGDKLMCGNIPITFLHTPGHTPGSQCFLVDGACVSGDTLFLDGCGRTDFPGSDPAAMYDSLQKLASLPTGTVVFPGHRYSAAPCAEIDDIKKHNYVFQPKDKESWLNWFS